MFQAKDLQVGHLYLLIDIDRNTPRINDLGARRILTGAELESFGLIVDNEGRYNLTDKGKEVIEQLVEHFRGLATV